MKNRELLIGLTIAAAIAAGAFWFFKRRKLTMLKSGVLYSADPAYDQAGY